MTDNRNVTELTVDELKNVVSDHSTAEIKKTVKETINETFTTYGFDTKSPLEVQKDMAWANRMRKTRIIEIFIALSSALFAYAKFKGS